MNVSSVNQPFFLESDDNADNVKDDDGNDADGNGDDGADDDGDDDDDNDCCELMWQPLFPELDEPWESDFQRTVKSFVEM